MIRFRLGDKGEKKQNTRRRSCGEGDANIRQKKEEGRSSGVREK